MENRKVQFHFRLDETPNLGAVEKSENGAKRRYLEGVASGIKTDGHGERMTEACMNSFMSQAESGDILLYVGLHGVNFVDDIGKLVGAKILPNGDWHCSFRLYDQADGMGPQTLEAADKLWRQVSGLPPYKTPKQKGFSIEGEVPPGGIITADQTGKRVMNDVTLTGVVVVDKPAYADSVAHAVYKALGVTPPWKIRKGLEKSLKDKLGEATGKENHLRKWYQLQDALDDGIRSIMSEEPAEQQERLQDLFTQFTELATKEILGHPESYAPAPTAGNGEPELTPNSQLVKLQGIVAKLRHLAELKKGANHGKK